MPIFFRAAIIKKKQRDLFQKRLLKEKRQFARKLPRSTISKLQQNYSQQISQKDLSRRHMWNLHCLLGLLSGYFLVYLWLFLAKNLLFWGYLWPYPAFHCYNRFVCCCCWFFSWRGDVTISKNCLIFYLRCPRVH